MAASFTSRSKDSDIRSVDRRSAQMSVFGVIRRIGRYSLLIFLSFLLLLSAFLWYITTDSFQQMVRGRLVASLEHATGGRVEIGSFHVAPFRFEVEVRDLTI